MKQPLVKRVLALVLAAAMAIGGLTVTPVLADSVSTWTKVDDIAAAAEASAAGKSVAITMTTSDGVTYALPTAEATNAGPAAKTADITESGVLSISGTEAEYGWTIAASDDGYLITNPDEKSLYLIANNNGVRINNQPDVGYLWSVTNGYLAATDPADVLRYVGIYTGTPNWRSYNSVNANIKDQTLNFWVFDSEEGEETVSTIAEALAGATDTDFTVKGVVTLVDGKNIYIQDGTGGICLYFSAVPSGISLGDTIKGKGTRAVYQNLPELKNATFTAITESSEQLTLSAKETDLSSLSAADVCTYVHIADLEVTEVSSTQITVSDVTGLTGILYKPVLGEKAVSVGDTIDFTGAVGIYGSTLQLRNTLADELVITSSDEPEEPEEPEVTYLDKFTEAPAAGSQLVIYYPGSSLVLTAAANGKKLTGTAAAPENDRLALTDEMAFLTVSVDEDGYYIFELDGTCLTSGETGNSLSFIESETDYSKWTLEQQSDGTWYVLNANAAYNGTKQALEYYNGFTTYGVKANNAAYKFEFYGIAASEPEPEPQTGLVTDLSQLTDGAAVVIYNPGNARAIGSETTNNWYLAAKEVAIEEGKAVNPDNDLIWTVSVSEDGVYTFTQGNYKITAYLSGTYVELTNDPSYDGGNYEWKLLECNPETDTWYIYSNGLTTNYGNSYLEVYTKKVNGVSSLYTCGYSTGTDKLTEAAYGFQFYLVENREDPDDPTPSGNTYGLASTLETGDEVILYHAGYGLGNTIASYKVTGVALTPEDGIITTDSTAVVWTVTKNDDGTYTFTQDNYTLGGVASGSYNNLVVSGATATKWTLTGPDAEDFNYFLYLGDMTSSYGNVYLEYYNGFTLYGSNSPTRDAFGITFYKKGADPETPTPSTGSDQLVTNLSQLTDGATVLIYSPTHYTAISSKPNGDWYLKAINTYLDDDGNPVDFTDELIWTVGVENGVYTFTSYADTSRQIAVWPSGTYAELTVNPNYNEETVTGWTLLPFSEENHTWYIKSSSLTLTKSGNALPVYIEAYVRNLIEVFSGYAPYSNQLSNTDYALQFYLVKPEDAVDVADDGEWDGVLTPGKSYVIYNESAKNEDTEDGSSLGLMKEATYSLTAITTKINASDNRAIPGNGAYVFTVSSMGRYYAFEVDGKYLATNNDEELFLLAPNEDGSVPETAKWFLYKDASSGRYILFNKDAQYGGSPVCIEFFSSVFSGWTYSTKNEIDIYLFSFHEVADDVEIRGGIVQDPSVNFDCEDTRYVGQDYALSFTLDDLAETIEDITITYTVGEQTVTVTEYTVSSDGKAYSAVLPGSAVDLSTAESFTITVTVNNSFEITYTGTKTVAIIDEPFFEDLTPAPNSQTRDEKSPVISAKIGNAGVGPAIEMYLTTGDVTRDITSSISYDGRTVLYAPEEALPDGRVTVRIVVTRADGVSAEKSWSFTVGFSDYQLYFGQLHSHTTYSDGSGSLETALEYIASLPESANVNFVAFTDHSNYFDTTSAANPADALNDRSLMTEASRALWEKYKSSVAEFNEMTESGVIAIAGFEMTWSGGPGHINTYDSDGLVSRNNSELNNKTNDAGMKLYYETIKKGNSLNQFNHPGTTFGNFTDFSYWDEATDENMFLVEVGNGEGQIGAGGYYPSYEQYDLALSQGWHVAPTNNQDNHKGRWGNANDARDVILTNSFTEEGIYDAIRNLRVYATEDKNLQVYYTVNGEPMGTIFSDEDSPEQLEIEVTIYDPNASDATAKVELIANSGKVVYTWSDVSVLAGGLLSVTLDPEYSYYYVRVTQEDGDIAVTAPVWTGKSIMVGIKDFTTDADNDLVLLGDTVTLTTSLFNNEETAVTLKSLTYTTNGSEVLGVDTEERAIAAGGTLDVTFGFKPTVAKIMTITVTAVFDVNGNELTYSKELTLTVRETEELPVTDIGIVNKVAEEGYEFAIEGIVTSNASGYDKDTAFFDCIYVQDATGGICCFPVSGEFKIGDKVHVEGYTDFYQGEAELQVTSIEIIGDGSVEPEEVSASDINDLVKLGSLVTLKGTVESVEVVNGLIQTILVKDADGAVARVFIDGYITTEEEVKNCEVGAAITATGISSYDNTWPDTDYFARIRVRNRADIVCEEPTYSITVTNYTGQRTPASTDIDPEGGYRGTVNVTVSCDLSCVVALKTEDGLVRLYGSETDGGCVYEITVESDVTLVIALKGDINLDGRVSSKDAYSSTLAASQAVTYSGIQFLTADVSGDGEITSRDTYLITMAASKAGPFEWDVVTP